MRVLVCGGRGFGVPRDPHDDEDMTQAIMEVRALCRMLDGVHETWGITAIIHGAAKGADDLGGWWARCRGVPEVTFPIAPEDWLIYGNRAGNRRNQLMLDDGKPDLVVAAPGGSGTRDMVRRAKDAGLKIIRVTPE